MIKEEEKRWQGWLIITIKATWRPGGDNWVVFTTVPDRHFRFASGSKPNIGQIGGAGFQHSPTVNSGMFWWWTDNPSDLAGLYPGRPAGPSIDLYKDLAFNIFQYNCIKVALSSTNDIFLHALQLAILIDLESVFYLWKSGFLPIRTVNENSVMNGILRVMLRLPNMQELKLLMFRWHSCSGWDWEHIAVDTASRGCQNFMNWCLQPMRT